MKTEDLKRIILKMFKGEFYGYDVHKKLASENVKIEISRLYRILNEMLKEGLLESSWEKSRFGPRKRVYRLGEKGRKQLENILIDAIKTIHGFYGEYLLSLPPKTSFFNSLSRLLTGKLKKQGDIAYLASKYSMMHERMISALHNSVPKGKIYFVKPAAVEADRKFDNLIFLDGTYDDIPLKNSYVDLLLTVDVPKKDWENAVKEWHRVLRQNGRLAILTPTVLIHKYEDPLTIGDFIEKYEHETIKGKNIDSEFLEKLLENFFQKVEKRQIVHMSIILASEPRSLKSSHKN